VNYRTKAQRKSGTNAAAFATMCLLLNDGEHTKDQLAEETGLVIGTIIKWLRILRSKKLVYIIGWKSGLAGAPAAVWVWGYEMPDAPRPKAKTQSEYSERYRAKKRGVFGLQGVPKVGGTRS
jgi:transcription initiation factor IIE alpha subunit